MLQNTLFPVTLTDNFLLRLVFALVLGGVIGFERDIHGRAAGLRTNMLVSLGAAAFMLVSEGVALAFSGGSFEEGVRVDPSRIAAQIITGIGFLGAGAIIKQGMNIRGLTTAACLWVSAGIGMAAGAGFFELALVVTAASVFTLVVVNLFEKAYPKDYYRTLAVTTSNDADISELIRRVKRQGIKILFLDFEKDYEANSMVVSFDIRIFHKGVTDKLSHRIVDDLEASGAPIRKVRWYH